jgi:wyosine [tRNA(Phe)-imidazoG37] synthetase (radical SAM superfamily)
MKVVYGPVHSWRLGRTLGVDIVASNRERCSFDCVYCPGDGRTHRVTRRAWFVGMSALQALLEAHRWEAEFEGECEPGFEADYVAFTGKGEPTLASNLGQAIELTRSLLFLPVAVFTNSSLMPRDDVRREVAKADMVVAKLDAPDEGLFRAINRPFVQYSLAEIVDALREFRSSFQGKFVIQTTVVDANRDSVHEVAAIAHSLSPDEIQLNSRLPGWTACTAAIEAEKIRSSFPDLNVTISDTGDPLWEQVVDWERVADVVQLQRSGRRNAEVMLMAAGAD